ncbi:hypothetical protein PROFUN_02785 [Planoprotostelium fungivorum]|uniref:Uncharacterized protein n=1 Tax=Planoprotostelium fungivorum TaxID=1890364 RepID=A0A2P6NXL3_9EUKA|nr:hypothetical protein PROFUN_02785 [Planoprotostelium fungivorum]
MNGPDATLNGVDITLFSGRSHQRLRRWQQCDPVKRSQKILLVPALILFARTTLVNIVSLSLNSTDIMWRTQLSKNFSTIDVFTRNEGRIGIMKYKGPAHCRATQYGNTRLKELLKMNPGLPSERFFVEGVWTRGMTGYIEVLFNGLPKIHRVITDGKTDSEIDSQLEKLVKLAETIGIPEPPEVPEFIHFFDRRNPGEPQTFCQYDDRYEEGCNPQIFIANPPDPEEK